MALINRYGLGGGFGVRTAIAATNYTVGTNERLLISDIMTSLDGAGGGTDIRIWLTNRTTGIDLHSIYLAAPNSVQRAFLIPIEVVGPCLVGIDELTGGVAGDASASWTGRNES